MLSWLDRNGKLLFASRTLRSFGYGFLSVVLVIYLSLIGFSEVSIGFILVAALANNVVFGLIASFFADRWGRRRTLIAFGGLMCLSGSIFVFSTNYFALIFAALIGTINVTGSDASFFLSVEQAIIPQTCSPERRNTAFAYYNAFASFATSIGALGSGLPEFLKTFTSSDLVSSTRLLFAIYVLLGLSMIGAYSFLSRDVEVRPESSISSFRLLSPQSRGTVTKLGALFSVDSFAGGFVIQSIFSYWFYVKFGLDLVQVSYIFAGSSFLAAFSYFAASRLADRFGLINTMVFTHFPSNVLLALVPLAPTSITAVLALLARSSLSQMDVPTRQSYVVAVVKPEERTTAAGITTIARNVTQSISPSITGYILQFISLSAPFFIAGGLKTLYDFGLYFSFRKLKPPEEAKR